jgi:hypothetical protein
MTVTVACITFYPGNSSTFISDPPWNNYWSFTSNGVLSGPAMGGVKVPAIANSADGNDLYVYANDADVNIQAQDGKVVLKAGDGEFLNDATNPDNQIATIGNLAYIRASVRRSSIGLEGDVEGMVADDGNFHYYCTGDYDGTNHVWKRVGWTAGTWGV